MRYKVILNPKIIIPRRIYIELKRHFRPITKNVFSKMVDSIWNKNDEVINLLITYYKTSEIYLEYGMGKSSILANKYINNGYIYSVESDKHYLNACTEYIQEQKYKNNNFISIHADIGLTTDYGYPLFGYKKRHFGFGFGRNKAKWSVYSKCGWNELIKERKLPDLIFIDGRFRVACVLQSLINLPEGSDCILVLDDYRDHYKVIEPFINIDRLIANKTLFFKKKINFDLEKSKILLDEYKSDPR